MSRLCAALVLIVGACQREARAQAKEMVWSGYLFKDKNGSTCMGWPVIAMGVVAGPARVLGKELAARMEPFVSRVGDELFRWNSRWYGSKGGPSRLPQTDVENTPRWLVALRGEVVEGPQVDTELRREIKRWLPHEYEDVRLPSLMMTRGRLLRVEYLSEGWLEAWRDLLRPDLRRLAAEREKELAPRALAALLKMKKAGTIPRALQQTVRKAEPTARIVRRFQVRHEDGAHRWLFDVNRKHGLWPEEEEDGIDWLFREPGKKREPHIQDLGELAPASGELQCWFLSSRDKAEFKRRLSSRGETVMNEVVYWYWVGEGGAYLGSATVGKVLNGWTDEEFQRRQSETRRTLEEYGHLPELVVKTKEMVWEGYLFRDEKGRVRIGWPVISMGVMVPPAYILGRELAEGLKPFISDLNRVHFFWNYSWLGYKDFHERELDHAPDVRKVPRVLVKLRGEVEMRERRRTSGLFPPSSDRRYEMGRARLLTVETLDEGWLMAWLEMVDLGFDPWWSRPEKRIEGDKAEVEKLAPKLLARLLEMKRHSQVTDAVRKRVRAADPNAKVVKHFQDGIEERAHRWLIEMKEEHGLDLVGLEQLGALPPGTREIRNWFLSAADKKAFFDKVRSRWKGDLDALILWYWRSEERSGWQARARLNEVEAWSEAVFKRHQASTRKQ